MISVVNLLQLLNGNRMRSFLAFVLVLLCGLLHSQVKQNDSLPIPVTIKGDQFYLHPIVKGNTLYSISRTYGITVDDIKLANKDLWQELRIGDTLKIPLKGIELFKEDQEQSDGNFLIHEVQKKNTLYSIAKEYDLEIADILAVNPEVEEKGLKKGMKLKIPIEKLKDEPKLDQYIEPSTASPYITHRVKPKETMYSLSKLYDVSIDSLMKVNNGLEGGLKVNQLLTIPILKEYTDSVDIDIEFDSTALKPSYVVSLLLPFYMEQMKMAEDTTPKVSQKMYQNLYAKAQYGLDFYHGIKLAADSLTEKGLNLELRVFDTANDTARLNQLIKDSALYGSDLLIGPLFYDEFVLAADYAKREGISIVSPVKQSNKILLGNSYVSKVVSSDPILIRSMGSYLADSLSEYNQVIVYPDHIKERTQVDQLKRTYFKEVVAKSDSQAVRVPKEVIWDPNDFQALLNKLDSTERNILVAPSEDQAFVTRLMTQLNQEEAYEITLLGMSDWKNYDYLEVEYLQNLDVHLMVSEHIDYSSPDTKEFERKYLSKFEMPPSKFSILGFDVGIYYLNLLNDYGANFDLMLLEYKEECLGRKFEFFRTGIESGYENHSVYLVRYRDFQLQKVF